MATTDDVDSSTDENYQIIGSHVSTVYYYTGCHWDYIYYHPSRTQHCMHINHTEMPQGVQITDHQADRIREISIQETLNISENWFSLSIEYADTRDELEAVEPGVVSEAVDKHLPEYDQLKARQ